MGFHLKPGCMTLFVLVRCGSQRPKDNRTELERYQYNECGANSKNPRGLPGDSSDAARMTCDNQIEWLL